MKKFDGRKMSRKVSAMARETLVFSGEALGIAALKLGREDIAYRTITGFRKAGAVSEAKVEGFLTHSAAVLEKKMEEVDLKDLRAKAEALLEETLDQAKSFDPSKLREAVRAQADRVITKETRIYGDSSHFHAVEDQVLPPGGHIVIEELPFEDPEEETKDTPQE